MNMLLEDQKIKIDINRAIKRHPLEVLEIDTRLRSGISVEKNCPLKDLEWYYEWGERINKSSSLNPDFYERLNRSSLILLAKKDKWFSRIMAWDISYRIEIPIELIELLKQLEKENG